MRGHLVYVTSTPAAEALAASSSASGASSSSVPAWISSGGSPRVRVAQRGDQGVGPGGWVGVGAGAGAEPARVEQHVAAHQVRDGPAVAAEIEPRRQQDAAGRGLLPFVAHRPGKGQGESAACRVTRHHHRARAGLAGQGSDDRAGVLECRRIGMLRCQPVFGQDNPAARLGAQVRRPRPGHVRRAQAIAAAVKVNHRQVRTRRPGGDHLGAQPGYRLLGDRGAPRKQGDPGELVQPRTLHRPGQSRVQAAPAELPHPEAHDRRRQAQPPAHAAGGHAALGPTIAGPFGMTRYAARSKRRTWYRYMNV